MTDDSSLNSVPLFDQALALRNVGGSVDVLREIISVFFEECPGWLTEIREGLAAGNSTTVRRGAHCLKGSLNIFGPSRARIVAQQLETMAHEQKLSDADEVVLQLEQTLRELRPVLEAVG